MLPEAGATELIFLAAVALIVVGPKDLPVLLRKVGQFTAKMRALAAEFRSSFDELARQSELDELRREVDALRRGDYTAPLRQDIQEIDGHFESLHREIGAPPPTGFGAREGEIVAGPDAPPMAEHVVEHSAEAQAAAADLVLPKPETPVTPVAQTPAEVAFEPKAEPHAQTSSHAQTSQPEHAPSHAPDPAAPAAPQSSEHAG